MSQTRVRTPVLPFFFFASLFVLSGPSAGPAGRWWRAQQRTQALVACGPIQQLQLKSSGNNIPLKKKPSSGNNSYSSYSCEVLLSVNSKLTIASFVYSSLLQQQLLF